MKERPKVKPPEPKEMPDDTREILLCIVSVLGLALILFLIAPK